MPRKRGEETENKGRAEATHAHNKNQPGSKIKSSGIPGCLGFHPGEPESNKCSLCPFEEVCSGLIAKQRLKKLTDKIAEIEEAEEKLEDALKTGTDRDSRQSLTAHRKGGGKP